MATFSIGSPHAAPSPSFALGVAMAQQLKNLDKSARSAQGPQRSAVRQQIDAAWRFVLNGATDAAEANRRAARVAGLMLGSAVLPGDLQRARRAHAGTCMADPYPFAAAALYAMLDAWEQHDAAHAMEDAFANMCMGGGSAPSGPWHPQPPSPGSRL